MTIKIYVANLAKYNAGELKGEWFTLPVDPQEIYEAIFDADELDEDGRPHGDYAIHDYEAPFKIDEYESLSKLNEWAEILERSSEYDDVIEAILGHFSDVSEGLNVLESEAYSVYHGCHDMADVAQEYVESTGLLHGVPDTIQRYFDFEAFGRDMDIEGTYIYAGNAMYVEIHN